MLILHHQTPLLGLVSLSLRKNVGAEMMGMYIERGFKRNDALKHYAHTTLHYKTTEALVSMFY